MGFDPVTGTALVVTATEVAAASAAATAAAAAAAAPVVVPAAAAAATTSAGISAGTLIAAGTAAASGGLALQAARARNEAIAASQRSQARAAGIAEQQLTEAAELERKKRINQANLIAARLRVSAGERGVGVGGSTNAFLRQLDFDASVNAAIINRNLANQRTAVRSGAAANIQSLLAGVTDPLLDAFSGALGGFSTGLQIGDVVT